MKIQQQLILGLAGISTLALGACAHDRYDHKCSDCPDHQPMHHSQSGDHSKQVSGNYEGERPTPFDQGKSKADRNTTAQIRRDIMAEDSLSVSAKNVKIITNSGRVTLRGWVKNADEMRTIEKIAKQAAGSRHVDNQLEIKT